MFWVYAVPSFWKNFFAGELIKKEAMQRLRLWQEEFLGTANGRRLVVKVGNPSEMVVEAALEKKAELTIVGAKNVGEGRYKGGTTLEGIVRHSQNSVWVAKKVGIKKIVCGVDLTLKSAQGLCWAIDIAQKLNAHLTILTAITGVALNFLGLKKAEISRIEQKKEREVKKNWLHL